MTVSNNKIFAQKIRAGVFYSLSAFALASFVLYGVFISGAINLSARAHAIELKTAEIAGKMSDMESKFIKISSAVTPSLAKDMGFVESENIQYVSRKPLAVLNSHE